MLWILAAGTLLVAKEASLEEVLNLPHSDELKHIEEELCEEEVTQLLSHPEVEAQVSTDEYLDQEMAAILHNEDLQSEEIDNIEPEIEDLKHLAKRPNVTISEPNPKHVESAYQQLSISVTDKQNISSILTTMAENNVFKLLFQKKRLEKLGRDINHVHPIRFLGTVFSDQRLIHCMYEIRRSTFKWDGFLDGFSQRFKEEVKAGNVKPYIPGFAAALNIKAEDIQAYINYNDFEGLVIYLMEKTR